MKYYEALGIEPRLALDLDALKKRFYELSREWHPDRFSRASASEQQKALDKTAVLNDAFRTLKEPVSRAEYFLEESGIPPSKNPPPELLEEMFELNEALEELRGTGFSLSSESDRLKPVPPQLIEAQKKYGKMLDEVAEQLDTLFKQHDEHRERAALQEIRGILDRRRYVANLMRDVEKELNVHVSN
jgi:molecular chaperone HscB